MYQIMKDQLANRVCIYALKYIIILKDYPAHSIVTVALQHTTVYGCSDISDDGRYVSCVNNVMLYSILSHCY